MSKSPPRLSSEDWLKAGFRTLTKEGPSALKAEKLARELGTTKGSFYWHFKNVSDFKTQMLAHWHQRAYADIAAQVDNVASPREQLLALADFAAVTPSGYGGNDAEPAIRDWSRADADVQIAVAQIDAQRIGYVEKLLAALGRPDPEAARIFYGAYVGMAMLKPKDPGAFANAMRRLILTLIA